MSSSLWLTTSLLGSSAANAASNSPGVMTMTSVPVFSAALVEASANGAKVRQTLTPASVNA